MTVWRSGGAILLLGLLAAAGTGWAKDRGGTAPAGVPDESLMDTIWRRVTPWTTPGDPADWVKASRPTEELSYMPVGVNPPKRKIKVKSAAELADTKEELEGLQARQADIAAGRPPSPLPRKKAKLDKTHPKAAAAETPGAAGDRATGSSLPDAAD